MISEATRMSLVREIHPAGAHIRELGRLKMARTLASLGFLCDNASRLVYVNTDEFVTMDLSGADLSSIASTLDLGNRPGQWRFKGHYASLHICYSYTMYVERGGRWSKETHCCGQSSSNVWGPDPVAPLLYPEDDSFNLLTDTGHDEVEFVRHLSSRAFNFVWGGIVETVHRYLFDVDFQAAKGQRTVAAGIFAELNHQERQGPREREGRCGQELPREVRLRPANEINVKVCTFTAAASERLQSLGVDANTFHRTFQLSLQT